jgi:hydroxyacylglutathione hydrolase
MSIMRVTESLAVIGSLQFGLSGPFDCSVYALRGPAGMVLIDSGGGTHTERLLENLARDLGRDAVKAVIVTHCHPDHCAGAAPLVRATGCRVMAPEMTADALERGDEDELLLSQAKEAGVYPADFDILPCPVAHRLRDGVPFEAAGLEFVPMHVRGHSDDSFVIRTTIGGAEWLFSGDVVFYGGVLGVINAAGSGMDGYRRDLPKLTGLGVEGLFPGHGLFTLRDGRRHLDAALAQARSGFLPRQIGQGDLIF